MIDYPQISASDADIERALKSASTPALMASMMYMSGDYSLLDGNLRPGEAVLGEVQGFMSEEDKAEVRRWALDIIRDYRDRGCTLPTAPDRETQARVMNFVVGKTEPIGDVYLELMMEEMALSGEDLRRVELDTSVSQQQRNEAKVVIIGAGMSGLLTAIRLQQSGIPFVILEKNQEVGGTWWENGYPGCRVDVASHFYSYSFEPAHEWNHYFAERDDLAEYFSMVADKYNLREHIVFGAEVSRARFHEEDNRWQLEYRQDGLVRSCDGRFLINAVGQLNRPKIPDLPGQNTFTGPQLHTAMWDTSVDLTGKRIAVVGNGASAFQLVPEVAKTAGELTVFQRSPAWMFPNMIYHDTVPDGEKWCLEYLPYYQKWFRFLLFWPGSDGAYVVLEIDPDWDDGGKSINAASKQYRDYLEGWIRQQVNDPELLANIIPDYPPMGKRILQDNGSWLAALQSDNVRLVCEGVTEVTKNGLVDASGKEHEVDVIIWATGFHSDRFLWPMEVVGLNGLTIAEHWSDEPTTYLGISTTHFPNMFTLYGPNTNLAHAGSVIFLAECQVKHVLAAIKMTLEAGAERIEVKREVEAAYDKKLREILPRLVWQHPKVSNWYQNSRGRVVSTLPWLLGEYWQWTSQADESEYQLKSQF